MAPCCSPGMEGPGVPSRGAPSPGGLGAHSAAVGAAWEARETHLEEGSEEEEEEPRGRVPGNEEDFAEKEEKEEMMEA